MLFPTVQHVHHLLRRFVDVIKALAFTAVPFLIIVRQSDYGTAIVLLVITVSIFFAARMPSSSLR